MLLHLECSIDTVLSRDGETWGTSLVCPLSSVPFLYAFHFEKKVVNVRRCDSIQSMTSKVTQLREQFKIDDQFHKRVYLFTYAFARPEGQRSLRILPRKLES